VDAVIRRPETSTSGDGARPDGAAREEPSDLAALLLGAAPHLQGGLEDLRILGGVRSDRLTLRLRRSFGVAQRAIAWSLASATLLVAGIVLLSIGTGRALAALFEPRPWLGQLVAGLGLLLGLGVATAVRGRLAERARIARLENKYARMESRSGSDAAAAP